MMFQDRVEPDIILRRATRHRRLEPFHNLASLSSTDFRGIGHDCHFVVVPKIADHPPLSVTHGVSLRPAIDEVGKFALLQCAR